MHRLMEKAGEEPFPDDVIRVLSQPTHDSLVDIRPDGLIFVSHPHYRDRLDAAFGPGAWALVPLEGAKIVGNRVVFHGFLKARGQYIADAYGGVNYFASNRTQNYDDAVEGAKSDCLVRCCKALPMFRECWDKEFGDYWKATYAEQVASNGGRGERIWRKKGTAVRGFSARPDRDPESAFAKPLRLEDENLAHIQAIQQETEGRLLVTIRDEYTSDDLPTEEDYREKWSHHEAAAKERGQTRKEEEW